MGCSFSGLNALYDTVNGGGDVWINENRFRIVRKLGEGGFAYVYLVKDIGIIEGGGGVGNKDSSHVSDDGTYAMKKVLIQNNEQLELVKEEVRVSSLFSHPNLLPLLDHAIIAVKPTQETSWNHEAYLLFPVHLERTLFDHAKVMKAKKEFFSTSDVLQIFRQLCAGLKHMHSFSLPYAHNDVKPGNVLITHRKGQPPLAILMDFGSAKPARKQIRSRSEALQLQDENKVDFKKLVSDNWVEPPKDSLAVDADHTEGSFKKSKHRDNVAISAEESLKKAKPRDNVAASAEESLKKAKPRDNVAASVEDPLKKAKPKIIAEISAHHTDDMLRKVRVKDKSLTKSHHGEDLTKKVKVKDNLTAYSYHGEDRSKDSWRNSTLVEIVVKSESDHQDPTRTGSSSETVAVEVSLLDPNGISPIKKYKDRNVSVDGLGCLNDEKHTSQDLNGNISDAAFSSARSSPRVRDTSNIATEVQEGQVHQDAHESMLASTSRSVMKEKTEAKEVHTKGSLSSQTSSLVDVKLDGGKHVHQHLKISVSEQPCEDLLVHETHSSSSPSVELAVTESKPLSCCEKTNTDEGMIPVSGEPCENTDVGSVGTLSLQESASKSKLLKNVEEPLKTGAINLRPSSPVSQRKVVPDFGRSSLSSTVLVSKSEVSGSCKPPGRPASPSTLRPVHFSKRVKPNSHSDIKKDHAATDTVKDDLGHEEPRNMAGEQFKSSVAGALKSSHLSRGSHGSTSERNSSDVNDSVLHPSAKASVAQNVTLSTVRIESVSKAQSDCTPQVQNKTTASGLSEKGERFNSSGSHPSSKATHSSSMHPPPPVNSSTLSDEELALLLHQELNSSPRVPRVPRMRQASGNPQSTPPTATSMLIKRASSSGAKDHILFSRRKGKEEVPKDASRNSREPIDENKKMNGVLSSHDHQTQDQGITSDVSTKKEAPSGSPEMRYTAKRNSPLSSTSFGQSSSFETIDQNLSSLHKSPRANSDDDYNDNAAGIAGPATRTLPGLLDEIMSKGRRMTYEELCNAVLPHWNNLRKHNGERYAYSSHSQAVLDCLRNRNEWAQLVDRGPKTTAGRKKRKIEPEAHTAEQEENGYGKSRATRELATKAFEAHPEDFPKGKRKARKRRRLALQGRGIKDIRKRQKSNVVTDEEDDEDEDNDAGPFSPSSDGGIFSEDSQGAKSRPTASEASSSFEDAGSL